MPDTRTTPPPTSAAVQTASGLRSCEVCGAEIQGGRLVTCSDGCRAEKWRKGQEQARRDREARVASLLREAIRLLENGGT
jgi:predicted nucleic acid-binding Zn ribbon protein